MSRGHRPHLHAARITALAALIAGLLIGSPVYASTISAVVAPHTRAALAGVSAAASTDAAGTGTIAGTVTKAGGAPIANVTVTILNLDGTPVGSVSTGTDGIFNFDWIPAGTYRVRYAAPGFITTYAGGTEKAGDAVQVTVTNGSTFDASTQLAPGGKLTGRVISSGGATFSATVTPYYLDEVTNTWAPGASTTVSVTASGGTYTVTATSTGPVRLLVAAAGAAINVWYGDAYNADDATPVQTESGATLSALDIHVPATATLAGTLTNNYGAPIPGKVQAYVRDRGHLSAVGTPLSTNANGTYTLKVPAGLDVTLKASQLDYTDTWFGDSTDSSTATFLTPTATETRTGQNIALAGGSTFSGRVVDHNTQPAAGITVSIVYNNTVYGRATTDANGSYHISGLTCALNFLEATYTGDGVTSDYWDGFQHNTCGSDLYLGQMRVSFDDAHTLHLLAPPTLVSDHTIGSTMSVTAGSYDQTPDSMGYSWNCGGGAWSYDPTYLIGFNMIGCGGNVDVYARKAGYGSAGSSLLLGLPDISYAAPGALTGIANVGQTLSYKLATWNYATASENGAGPRNMIEWQRDGVPFQWDTATYKLTTADIGHHIRVHETVQFGSWNIGFQSREYTSGSTAAVAPATTTAANPPGKATAALAVRATGLKKKVKATITLTTAAVRAAGGTVLVKLDKKTIARLVGGPRTWKIAKKAKKGRHTLTVSYAGSATVNAAATKKVKVRVR